MRDLQRHLRDARCSGLAWRAGALVDAMGARLPDLWMVATSELPHAALPRDAA